MNITIYITAILLTWVLRSSSADDQCPYKECTCGRRVIFCGNLGLVTLPTLVTTEPTDNVMLTLDTNKITALPAGALPHGLTEISLMDNPVTTIDDAAFDGSASTLNTLSFSGARFTRIPDAFLHLNSLTDFSISHTYINDWNVDAMKKIGTTVQTLSLEDVGFNEWPDWISYFSQLTELSIVSSSFSFLPDGALHNVASTLTTLTLMNNSLTAVPRALSELVSLYMLNLVHTKISDLTYLPQGSKLSSLALDNTSLTNATHVSTMLHPYSDSLLNIYLEGNQLDAIPNLSFLNKLGSIVLSHNRISDPFSGSMPSSCYNVDLGYNFLRSIPSIMSSLYSVTSLVLPWNNIMLINDLDFHTSVTEVDLGFNEIIELKDASFPVNSGIQILTLNYNPIYKISGRAFINLQQLSDLYMQSTRLTRLPLALGSLSSLKLLDVSGSRSLICTCVESTLRPTIMGLDSLHGDCGVISVTNFFTNLSPSCNTRRYYSTQ